ncbi:MAG: Selenide, water dikinase [Firmicutes bacterium ADurb.Bin153]|nr:MAG: Selenide, water dikinase [Firmicutes bacterium ADurb.Bin153]
MGPADLHRIMSHIPPQVAENLIVGTATYDDAAVYSLGGDIAIVQTVDFFTPIVDDPYDFGAIAASNALSDIYAMGARPVIALNIACFPRDLGEEVLGAIVKGGAEKVNEAGAVVAGGHTVEDEDLKFGLSVTGIVEKSRITANSNARPNDMLVLTKAIGTGVISTAIKNEMCPEESAEAARLSMLALNRAASEAMVEAGARAATDITGFGFFGHLFEMAEASGTSAEVWLEDVPLLPGAARLAEEGFLPGGAARNRSWLADKVEVDAGVPMSVASLMFDPQTSGGLLVAIPEQALGALVQGLEAGGCMHSVIGRMIPRSDRMIRARFRRP